MKRITQEMVLDEVRKHPEGISTRALALGFLGDLKCEYYPLRCKVDQRCSQLKKCGFVRQEIGRHTGIGNPHMSVWYPVVE